MGLLKSAWSFCQGWSGKSLVAGEQKMYEVGLHGMDGKMRQSLAACLPE